MVKTGNRFIELLIELTMRDIKVRYKLSILGIYWAILNPLLLAGVWWFVFSNIFRAQGIEGVPYLLFLFAGITFWNLFSNSLYSAVNSLTGNASLLTKTYFQRIVLPTSSVFARLVDFAFSFLVLLFLMLVYGISIHVEILWIFPLLFFQLLFTLGMAYMVSSLNVLYRDTSQIINIILMLWMYISPIFYTFEQIPDSIKAFYSFNPIGQLVHMGVRAVLNHEAPNGFYLLSSGISSVVVFLIGVIVFKHLEDLFAEVM